MRALCCAVLSVALVGSVSACDPCLMTVAFRYFGIDDLFDWMLEDLDGPGVLAEDAKASSDLERTSALLLKDACLQAGIPASELQIGQNHFDSATADETDAFAHITDAYTHVADASGHHTTGDAHYLNEDYHDACDEFDEVDAEMLGAGVAGGGAKEDFELAKEDYEASGAGFTNAYNEWDSVWNEWFPEE